MKVYRCQLSYDGIASLCHGERGRWFGTKSTDRWGTAYDGGQSPSLIQVKWDGTKCKQTFSRTFIALYPEEPDAPTAT